MLLDESIAKRMREKMTREVLNKTRPFSRPLRRLQKEGGFM
jgi:hypothetical protein